jgi:hypothetical protein
MLQRLASAFLNRKTPVDEKFSALLAQVEKLTKDAEEAMEAAAKADQRLQDAWKVLRRIEADRDEWNALFKRQWREHNNAQAMLVNALSRARGQARKFQNAMNKKLAAEGKKQLNVPLLADDDPPAEVATTYKKAMAAAEEAGPPCNTKYPSTT